MHELFARQSALQAEAFGGDPSGFAGERLRLFLQEMTLGALDEIHEALAHVGWKSWASSRHFDRQEFGEELVDALHFIVALLLAAGWTADRVEECYAHKSGENARRQRDGYEGVRA